MPSPSVALDPARSPVACALAGLLALAVAMGFGRFAFTPILPMMLEDAGLSLRHGGWLASANYAGYLAGALSATVLPVRGQAAIRAGLAVISVSTLAMALSLPLAGWILLRFAAGIGSAWVLIAVSTWSLGTLARLQRPGPSGIVFAGVGTGIAAAGLLAIVLLRADAASSHAWLVLGALSSCVALVLWRAFPGGALAGGSSTPQTSPAIRWNAEAVRLTLCYGVFGFGYIIPATFLPVMAKRSLEDPSLFGWAWPLFGVAAIISTLLVAPASRRYSSRELSVAYFLVMAIGVALPALQPTIVSIAVAALAVGGSFVALTLTAMQEARRLAGSNGGPLIAAMTSAFAVGQILGPLSVTTESTAQPQATSFAGPLWLAAALLLCSGLALARRPTSASPPGEAA